MEVGDKTVNLIATKQIEYKDKQGVIWHKGWNLKDIDTQKVYGSMLYNSHWTDGKCVGGFCVTIYNPVHADLGSISCETYPTKEEALTKARGQIESLRRPTFTQYQEALERIKESRYRDEMSDDFAYTNGKLARWDRIEREVRTLMERVA